MKNSLLDTNVKKTDKKYSDREKRLFFLLLSRQSSREMAPFNTRLTFGAILLAAKMSSLHLANNFSEDTAPKSVNGKVGRDDI